MQTPAKTVRIIMIAVQMNDTVKQPTEKGETS